jgi:hypothetical protein
MEGAELARQLEDLADQFDQRAVPDQGRYVPAPGADAPHQLHP